MRMWLAPSAFFPARGGVEELTLQLAKEYLRRGHEVTVVVHRNPMELPRHEEIDGVPVVRLSLDLPGTSASRLLRLPVALARQLGELERVTPRPDLVHVQCPSNQVMPVSLYARRHGVPLVLTTQGEVTMDANRIYQRSVQMRWSLRLGSRLASAFTACSRRAGEDATSVAPRFRGCAVVPNGVDVEQWTVSPLPARPVFAAWGRHIPAEGVRPLDRRVRRGQT